MAIGVMPNSIEGFFYPRGAYLLLWAALLAAAVLVHLSFRRNATRTMLGSVVGLTGAHALGLLLAIEDFPPSSRSGGLIGLGPLLVPVALAAPFLNLTAPWILALAVVRLSPHPRVRYRRWYERTPLIVAALVVLAPVTVGLSAIVSSAHTLFVLTAFAAGIAYSLRQAKDPWSSIASGVTVLGFSTMAFALINHAWLHQYHHDGWYLQGPGFSGSYVADGIAIPYVLGAAAVLGGFVWQIWAQRMVKPADVVYPG